MTPDAAAPDARDRATTSAVRSLLFGLAPVAITLAAVTLAPALPVPFVALVSFVVVAVSVFFAIVQGVRALRLLRPLREERAREQQRFSRAGAAAVTARSTDRALRTLHAMAMTGLVLGCVHGLFLLGSLALTLPGMFWLASVR